VDPLERLGRNLREMRTKKGFSQEALAEAADVHRTEVSLLERAGREPRLGTLLRLARALGTDLSELVRGIR